MKNFKSPRAALGELPAEEAATLLNAASDIVVVMDMKGVVRDVAISGAELDDPALADLVGKRFVDSVTLESRPKIEQMLSDDASPSPAPVRWRQVNHPSSKGGADLPVLYSAVRVGAGRARRIVAVGRELISASRLQQRLIEAQHSMERDYGRLRSVETRYRLLFQMVPECILVLDASSQRILEANPAAEAALGSPSRHLVGQAFPVGLGKKSAAEIQAMLSALRVTGRPAQCRTKGPDGKSDWIANGSLLRQDGGSLFLLRLLPETPAVKHVGGTSVTDSTLVSAVVNAPDGFILTTAQGQVLSANTAFLSLCQIATEDQALGNTLDRWLGREGVDLNVLSANLRQNGSVRLFATTLRGEQGAVTDVEISAVAIPEHGEVHYAFSVRDVSRRLQADNGGARELPRSVGQIAELVGRVALKDLVREATDAIERLCIEAALELTQDNRASAAEMLGLSRQSLYVKLRRYGLADLNGS